MAAALAAGSGAESPVRCSFPGSARECGAPKGTILVRWREAAADRQPELWLDDGVTPASTLLELDSHRAFAARAWPSARTLRFEIRASDANAAEEYRRTFVYDLSGEVRSPAQRPAYPAHWFAPVPKEGAPAWEILPQEAGPGEVILSKRHELGLLSNFAATPFTFRGQRYASLEGFWQMMLYPEGPDDPRATFPGLTWKHTRAEVAQMTAFAAKDAGTLAEENMKQMGIGWVTFEGKRIEYRFAGQGEHYRLIEAATREKVRQNPEVKRVLLATGDLILRPDHQQEPDPPAAWRYFEILTRIRSDLQAGKDPS